MNPPWPAMGPSPDQINYPPWATEIPGLRCPSDPGKGLPALGRTNYVACQGDSAAGDLNRGRLGLELQETQADDERSRAADRGVFVLHKSMRFRDILDGLANSICMGEIATDLGDNDNRTTHLHGQGSGVYNNPSACSDRAGWIDATRPQFWDPAVAPVYGSTSYRRGFRWASSAPLMGGVTTILPPNREICINFNWDSTAVATPSSRHQGGCHVLMTDGAVKFVTDSIEAGNSRNPMVRSSGTAANNNQVGALSPYGLWGALGTRASKEVIDKEF